MVHAGQNTKMWPGAQAACVLPMGLGMLFTLFSLSLGRPGDLFMALPVALCFIFGAPLSAWLACRRLRKIKDVKRLSRWGVSFWAGLLWSSAVHFVAALIYTIGFTILTGQDSLQSGSGDDNEILLILFMAGYMNVLLWCVLTLPFALICASIFWRVTEFPKDATVF